MYSTDAFCSKDTLSKIKPPIFLKTKKDYPDQMQDGESVQYVCKNDSLIVPDELDGDSNFAIDVVLSTII